jgi:hypothetical protein
MKHAYNVSSRPLHRNLLPGAGEMRSKRAESGDLTDEYMYRFSRRGHTFKLAL